MFLLMRERNIYQLPPVCTLTRNQTHNFLVYETTLQPTEPLGQGKNIMHHQRVGTVGLPADWGLEPQHEGLGRDTEDGPRPTPVPTTALLPTFPFKVHKFVHWDPS